MEEPSESAQRTLEVTRLLRAESDGGGDRAALLELVYEELRAIAERRMRAERSSHTLQATALVHEAWMRLERDQDMEFRDRRHFFGAAGEVMRRVLVDHARRVKAEKRGGGELKVTLGAAELEADFDAEHLLLLDDALGELEREDPRAAAVTRLRFLSGLSAEETAEELGVSERTVHREWTYARARLFELLGEA